jgi:hypothetical protein
MDRRELWGRVTMAGQREAARVAFLARRPRWRREALINALSETAAELGPIRASLARKEWMSAHRQLVQHVIQAQPRFVISPADRPARVTTIQQHFPEAIHDAVARADRIVDGRFDLLGYRGLVFGEAGSPPDWHLDPVHQRRAQDGFWTRVPYLAPECGDHKIIWELNRHQSWLALGRAYWLTSDERYRTAFVSQFESWMAANPPLSGVNWASMLELGLRSLSWLWALNFFAQVEDGSAPDRAPWAVDLLLGIDRQLRLVERNLSRYFSPNTHLLGEALALYVVGRCLPELRRAGGWERLGRTVLLEQIERQIHRDGGHAELSTHYHRYTLDFYLLALIVARRTRDASAGAFGAAVDALAKFARTMADDVGRLPTIGDDDGGSLFPLCGRAPFDASDSLHLAAEVLNQPRLASGPPAEEVVWLEGAAPSRDRQSAWPSAALPDSGYYVSRTPRGDHLTIDAGRHGFLNGGHAHADALSITLTIRSRPFLIDPGTACYTIDSATRDRFRSTRFHNTLILEGRPQSAPAGPFHWQSAAHGTALEWRTTEDFDLFEGTHDGYRPYGHHRTVLSRPGCWYIVDRVTGKGVRNTELYWHIDPAWRVEMTAPNSVCAVDGAGRRVWLVTLNGHCDLFTGSEELGWYAPIYGQLVRATTVRATYAAESSASVVTAIIENEDSPLISPILLTTPTGVSRGGVAFTIRTSQWTEVVAFSRWAGQQNASEPVGPYNAAGIATDARVLCWREGPAHAGPIVLVDGTFAEPRVCADGTDKSRQTKEHQRSCAG